jgi:hypothetical protein
MVTMGEYGDVRLGHEARMQARTRGALVALLAFVMIACTASAASAKSASNAEFSCTAITIHYTGFPELPRNTIKESVRVDKLRGAVKKEFKFDGPEGTDTIPVNLPPGHHSLDIFAVWRTNGVRGSRDQSLHGGIKCATEPALAIQKLQKFEGESGYTEAPLAHGRVGQMIDYEMTVRNTGDVSLTISSFNDRKCDPGTITGGPGVEILTPAGPTSSGGSATYLCTHEITEADAEAGFYANVAEATGLPQACNGSGCNPVTGESNTVVVTVVPPPSPAFTIEKLQKTTGSFTEEALTGEVGQTVDYEIVVTNTSNTALTLSSFSDGHCDPGTIEGGPGTKALVPGQATTYTCSHKLTAADQAAGRYENVATETAEAAQAPAGAPITHTSNTVVVSIAPAPTPTPKTEPAPSTSTGTPTTTTATPEGGVLAFTGETPSLSGPHACVRRGFAASVKAAGVKSVTFYLDGHRLKTLTAKDARKGMLTVYVRSAQLRRGSHNLVALIAITPNTASAKPAKVSRSLRVARCASVSAGPRFAG